MFKSFALIALAGVASASYGYGQQRGYGYGVQQYSAPSYDYQPKRGDGFDDGYSKGFAGYGYGSRRHQTLDLDDEKEPKIYGRKDARREDADINTDKESPDYRHENGDHQYQEYGEKDVRNDDDLDARGLSGLTGGSREQAYGYRKPDLDDYQPRRAYGGYDDDDYSGRPSYGYQGGYQLGSEGYDVVDYEEDYSSPYGRRSVYDDYGFGPSQIEYGLSRRSPYGDDGYGDVSFSRFGLGRGYGEPTYRRPEPQYRPSYGGYGRPDGYDDGYQTRGYSSPYDQGRRHRTLDLDDEKERIPYGPRKDARREDADINTDKESPDYRHENGDHQLQEYGEKDVRNDDDLDARGLSGLTGGSREKGYSRQSYGYQQPSYEAPSYKIPEVRYEQQPSYGYQQPSYGYQQPSYGRKW